MENKKVLIAEDDVFISEMYNTKIESRGFKVLIAVNGEEAIDIIKREKPEVILLDILMPKIDGWAVLKEITSDKKNIENSVIIILTNIGDDKSVEKAIKMGADDYLIKSLHTPEEIVKKIEKALNNKFNKNKQKNEFTNYPKI